MTALKTGEIARFLDAPDPRYALILVYGRDSGSVSERTDRLVRTIAGGSDDPFSVLRIDGDELAADPLRLADEANTIGLFGGRRVIRVRLGAKPIQRAVEPLIAAPPQDAVVIIEAGDLMKSAPLRVLIERSKSAAALPCYLDEARDIGRLIDEEVRATGLRIDPDARELLTRLVGGDRLASRSEVAKVATFALTDGVIHANHVEAVVGNAADTAIDHLVDASFLGDRAEVSAIFARLVADGTRTDALMAAALRHALLLTRLATEIAGGAAPEDVVRKGVPFFRRQTAVTRQLERWTPDGGLAAAAAIAAALTSGRKQARLAESLAERCLLSMRQLAKPVSGATSA